MWTMKLLQLVILAALTLPRMAVAQYTDPAGNEEFGRSGERHPKGPPAKETPVITVVEIEGPLAPADFQKLFATTEEQTREYQQVFDSFTVATSEPRETAKHRLEQLGTATGRDSAAVDYYKERLKELSKTLREAQSRFDERMKRLLNKDQQKQYRDWRKRQDDLAKNSAVPTGNKRRGGRPAPQ
jgi:Spy/CpxP family protein refolding chaperone